MVPGEVVSAQARSGSWSSHSPDFIPQNIFMGMLQGVVCQEVPSTLENTKNPIIDDYAVMNPQVIKLNDVGSYSWNICNTTLTLMVNIPIASLNNFVGSNYQAIHLG
jgi:hypothetical protein